jgi:hypothetical protein
MPGRIKRQPSGRNLELYFELVCEGRRQVDVAARFRVSRPRVTQLRREVAAWVDELLPEDAGRVLQDAGQRLHLAIALRRVQIAADYGAYLAHFGGVSGAAGFGHLLAARDAGVLPQEVTDQLRPRKLIETAVRMARELTALTDLWARGPLSSLDPGAPSAAEARSDHGSPISPQRM